MLLEVRHEESSGTSNDMGLGTALLDDRPTGDAQILTPIQSISLIGDL